MTTRPLSPFGLEVTFPEPAALTSLDTAQVKAWVAGHRLVALRGLADPDDDTMRAFCEQLGTILEWEFGAVNELRVRDGATNYLYTSREVPFHWDGAFVGRVPHYIFFHCRVAPPSGSGGQTTFCDTPRLLASISPEERAVWERVRVTYSTEKIVHYGGTFTSPLLAKHPVSGEEVLRFAEPVEDLNPVQLKLEGIEPAERAAFLVRMHDLLNATTLCYAHDWQPGDVVLADNHALLHGRRPFTQPAARHLRRINVL